jgi:hypothetical protein
MKNINMYEIIVPNREAFLFWENNGKLYHEKDPTATHPMYIQDKNYANYKHIFGENNNQIYDEVKNPFPKEYFPERLYASTILVLNTLDDIQKCLKWVIKQHAITSGLDDGKNLIIAHRKIDKFLEMAAFLNKNITNRKINWLT